MNSNLLDETLANNARSEKLRKEYLAKEHQHDFLTGLSSMTHYFILEDLGRKQNLEKGKHSAIIYLNMRGMKDFNRRYGFSEGDSLILQVSKILAKHFGKENCGRFSSDHFSAFTEAEGVEEKLNAVFQDAKEINEGKTLPIIAGIYLDEIEYVNASMACDRAKMACDAISHSAVSTFHYFDLNMLEEEKKRQYIIDNLDRAIEEGWIQVYYQPIIRVASGQICEEEALARWIDPERGMIYPGEFIPVLEESGLIYKLDLCVVDHVLEKKKLLSEKNFHIVPGSVNISRSDFDACDIVEEIRRRVDDAGIERDRLNIEITESVIGSDFQYISSQIERFRELGFHVWMDDFGSGYSSLDVLLNIQFDLIKLDMHFIQQLDQSPKSRIILTEVMKMIVSLGTEALCEGVETKEQMEFLMGIGCTKVQGYYFCKPLPLDEILYRYEHGAKVGFENPLEVEYFSAISSFNTNDPSVINTTDSSALSHYVDSIPVVVLEMTDKTVELIRFNQPGKDFFSQFTPLSCENGRIILDANDRPRFVEAAKSCREKSGWYKLDDTMSDGTTVQSFIRHLATNPVTGVWAVAVVVLAIVSD